MTKTKWFLLVMVLPAALAPYLWASGAGPGIQPDEALTKLKDGNARYVSGAPQHPDQDRCRRQRPQAGTASAPGSVHHQDQTSQAR